jgi:xylulokinase
MSESELLLGIDIGTTRIKALLASPDGRVAGVRVSQTPFETVNGRVEMSLDSLRAAITAAVAPLGDERRRVIAVGIASMGETGVPIDRSGRTAGPLIAWHDQRGARVVRRLVEAFGDGLPARVGQATRTQSSIAKIGWFLQHNVNVTRWLGAAELGLWTLTGEEATEPSLACRTGAFDIRRTCFIEGVVTAVGAPPTVFPPVRRAGDSHGLVSREGAAWLGLPMGIPVTVAGHDHMVGAVGVGVNSADLLNSVGTAETLVRYASSELDLADAVAHGADVSIDPSRGGLAIMAGDLRPGQIVEAVRRMFGDASFEELNRRDQFRELEADSHERQQGR